MMRIMIACLAPQRRAAAEKDQRDGREEDECTHRSAFLLNALIRAENSESVAERAVSAPVTAPNLVTRRWLRLRSQSSTF